MRAQSLHQGDPLEAGRVIHSSTLAWCIQWTEETGGQWSCGPSGRKESDMTDATKHAC